MIPIGYHKIVELLRGPDFQSINPYKRLVVLQAADAIERLTGMIDEVYIGRKTKVKVTVKRRSEK